MCETNITELKNICADNCSCGKAHALSIKAILSGKGTLAKLPEILKKEYSPKKAFVLADTNTYHAAGKIVCKLLEENGIGCSSYVFIENDLEPDENSIGSAVMYFDNSCDVIIAAGSGVINDIGKILAAISEKPYIIVGTAPSMDGYASATSSVTRDGLKISLPSKNADIIVGDTDILCAAPEIMLKSGLGDMLAKYISICEWRISHIINGEYYCENIAELVRNALKCCTDNAEGLLKREPAAVEAVFNGLVITGAAMSLAGVSRPASGCEHYISHLWDMRKAEFGTYCNLHGIQCAVGTYTCAKLYEVIKKTVPDKEKALAYVSSFDYKKRACLLSKFLGKGAKTMIELEAKEGKYDKYKHEERLSVIIENWDKILKVIQEEIPDIDTIDKLFDTVGLPKTPDDAGTDSSLLAETFEYAGDIRDKYVLSRLAWDLGIMDEMKKVL